MIAAHREAVDRGFMVFEGPEGFGADIPVGFVCGVSRGALISIRIVHVCDDSGYQIET
jgi:hypothetical protein